MNYFLSAFLSLHQNLDSGLSISLHRLTGSFKLDIAESGNAEAAAFSRTSLPAGDKKCSA